MTDTIPQVLDSTKRVLRTVVQVAIPSFIALAAGLPILLEQAKVFVSPQLYAALVGLAAGITVVAGVLAKVMANPTVNGWLTSIGLAGHSGEQVAGDTWTTMVAAQAPANH